MMTQRECDIALLEAKMIVEDLFGEWRQSYLGRRAERMMQNAEADRGLRANEQAGGAQYGGGAPAASPTAY